MASAVISRRRSRMLVVSPDPSLTNAVRRVMEARPLEVTVIEDVTALPALPDASRRETLVALLDVDAPGALEVIAKEERLGGRLFGITLLAVSDHPARHSGNEGDHDEPSRWSAAFAKPIAAPELLRVIDREIAFENYEPPGRAAR